MPKQNYLNRSFNNYINIFVNPALFICLLTDPAMVIAQTHNHPVVFKKHIISSSFLSEGVAVGDVNKDGKMDILAGIYWFEAPNWKAHPIHADTLRPVPGYSTSFINFTTDLNRDGWIDLIRFDQPGGNCYWYENPKNKTGLWKGQLVLESAGIESPALVDVDGDGQLEIICNDAAAKQVIWLKPTLSKNELSWQRFIISNDSLRATNRYTHGLGWGDMNRDGRKDVIIKTGWWESPKDAKEPNWIFHEANLGKDCGHMFALDADQDGDADVISSSAHNYGVWWHEQKGQGWTSHDISNLFSQSHALAFEDINADGHPDIITGKRYLAHIQGDPGTHDPSVLYWFEYVPGKQPRWIPHQVDDNSGIGNNFVVQDINNDKLVDIIISNKKGVFFFEQKAN